MPPRRRKHHLEARDFVKAIQADTKYEYDVEDAVTLLLNLVSYTPIPGIPLAPDARLRNCEDVYRVFNEATLRWHLIAATLRDAKEKGY